MKYIFKSVQYKSRLTTIIMVAYSITVFLKLVFVDEIAVLISFSSAIGSCFMLLALKIWGLVFFKRDFRPVNFKQFVSFLVFSTLFLLVALLMLSPIFISHYSNL